MSNVQFWKFFGIKVTPYRSDVLPNTKQLVAGV